MRHLTRIGLATALLVTALAGLPVAGAEAGTTTAQARTAADPPHWVRIKNARSGKCLGISASSTANGGKAIQWRCLNGEEDQQWSFEVKTALPLTYWVKNRNSRKCLAIPNGSIDPGTQAIQWTCLDKDDQGWAVVESPFESGVRLVNDHSFLTLGISAGSLVDGARAIQWTYEPGNNDQNWKW
jgi:Ricin-type beta-trefoil lectin domain-like